MQQACYVRRDLDARADVTERGGEAADPAADDEHVERERGFAAVVERGDRVNRRGAEVGSAGVCHVGLSRWLGAWWVLELGE